MNLIKRELDDYRLLLRNVPSLVVTIFVVSVIAMNLLANKEIFSVKYLALDCGFSLSWISFLCMDMLCKRFGGKAAAKISILALAINLITCLIFKLISLTPGMWGEFYSTGLIEVNTALNSTIGGCWYVVLGSSTAMLVSSICNSLINQSIARQLKTSGFKAFALRSYVSTGISQFIDNLVFATIVSHYFFGWTWIQVLLCSVTAASFELLCEIVFSPLGYRISQQWERENVGENYLKFNN
ncbi:MAG: VUT family protein [Bacillota bacterium]|nr:VUT family protein [Bacillota bacterium]